MNSIIFLAAGTSATIMLAGVLQSVFGGHEAIFWKGAMWGSGALWGIYLICVGLDDIADHVSKAIKYNLIVLAVLFVGVFIFAKKHDSSGNLIADATEEKAGDDFAEKELKKFKSNEGRELQGKIQDLEILDKGFSNSIEKLRAVLESINKDPETDEDLQKWEKKRSELHTEKAKLVEKLKEAFLAFQKSKLTPTGEQSERMTELLANGVAEAESMTAQFVDFQQEMEGTSKEDSKGEDDNSNDDESDPES
jgi:hypothetical protein